MRSALKLTAPPTWLLLLALLLPVSGRAADVGEIAVVQADPTIVDPGNPFPFGGQTVRFRPAGTGYAIESGALEPEGDKGDLSAALRADPAEVDLGFEFPYFGKSYRKLYAYLNGIVAFEKLQQLPLRPSPKSIAGQPPLIAAFWSPAVRHSPGAGATDGIYVNSKMPDRVILTWYQVMPQKVESVVNTYQATWSKDGSIQISYREIQYPEGLVGLFAGDAGTRPISVSLKAAGPFANAGGFFEQFRLPHSIPQKLTQAFYRDHADVFDALAIFETFQLSHPGFFSSFPVKYRAQGTGGGQLVDRSRSFGSQGRLESYLELNQLSCYPRNTASAMLTRAYGYRAVQQLIQEQGSSGGTNPVPRNLRMAFVLLVPPGTSPSSGAIAQLDAIRTSWERDFAGYGLGVATMDTRLTSSGAGTESQVVGSAPPAGTAESAPSNVAPAPDNRTQEQGSSPEMQGQAPAAQTPVGQPERTSVAGAMKQQLRAALADRVAKVLGHGVDLAFGELDKKLDNWDGTKPGPQGDMGGSSAGLPAGAVNTPPQEAQATSSAGTAVESTASVQTPMQAAQSEEIRPDLILTSGDIHVSPASPRAGKQLEIAVTVRNVGSADARGANLRCALIADRRIVAKKDFVIDVPAGRATVVRWALPTPAGGQLVVNALAVALGDIHPNNKASVSIVPSK